MSDRLEHIARVVSVAAGLLVLVSLPAAAIQTGLTRAETMLERGQFSEAAELLAARARAGDIEATAMLARLYTQGAGVPQDFARAAELNRLAAEQGSAMGQNALGRAYSAGYGVPLDPEQSLRWLRTAAEAGEPSHQLDYGLALETGLNGLADPAAAAIWYQAAAEQGFVPAMTSLGILYLQGSGVERNTVEALRLFEMAAEADDPRALNNLGLMYVRGEGVERDYAAAAPLLERAAEQGVSEAMRNLSVLYESGQGVRLDEERARDLLAQARALEAGRLPALLSAIGFPYDPGLVEPDWQAPLNPQMEDAAAAGDVLALYETAFRYLHGAGVRQDIPQAVTRLERAARQGLGTAAFSLCLLEANGAGRPQNYYSAYSWCSVAAYRGVAGAAAVRDGLASAIGPDRLAGAQERTLEILAIEN